MSDPILITGPARSGTSMTAGIIYLSGAWGGQMSGPTPFNKKGMFEHPIIRQNVKKLLEKYGLDPLGQNPLPTDQDNELIASNYLTWRREVNLIITSQGYHHNCPWFYKGAKMILMWKLWNDAFPNAKWIYVNRHIDGIVGSCLKTPFMHKNTTKEEWINWINRHLECKQQMIDAGIEIRNVYPDKIIGGDFVGIENIVGELGLIWNEELIKNFIDPKLWGGVKHGEKQ